MYYCRKLKKYYGLYNFRLTNVIFVFLYETDRADLYILTLLLVVTSLCDPCVESNEFSTDYGNVQVINI